LLEARQVALLDAAAFAKISAMLIIASCRCLFFRRRHAITPPCHYAIRLL